MSLPFCPCRGARRRSRRPQTANPLLRFSEKLSTREGEPPARFKYLAQLVQKKVPPVRREHACGSSSAPIQPVLNSQIEISGISADNSAYTCIMEDKIMNITVYLGANEGREPALKTAVCELGTWIGEHGHTLVYGGSRVGLMGAVAASTLAAGGKVIGVEPRFFIEQELQLDGLTELIVTEDMTDRKTKMIELGDAFIAFPGGTGTLEEIAEVMSKLALNHLDAPCIFYNLNGYYDHMKALLDHMIEMELSTKERQKKIYFADTLEEVTALLN